SANERGCLPCVDNGSGFLDDAAAGGAAVVAHPGNSRRGIERLTDGELYYIIQNGVRLTGRFYKSSSSNVRRRRGGHEGNESEKPGGVSIEFKECAVTDRTYKLGSLTVGAVYDRPIPQFRDRN